MIRNISLYTTASNSPTGKLSKHTLNKAIDLVSVDFAKVERAFIYYYPGGLMSIWNEFNSTAMLLKPKPNLRRSQTMTKKEIEIQKALGTLPYKEWMKLKGIIFDDNDINSKNRLSKDIIWWYFPIEKGMRSRYAAHIVTIDNFKYYPVADAYIEDSYHSMAWRKWSEEELAKEIIAQCYSCMSLENIDH